MLINEMDEYFEEIVLNEILENDFVFGQYLDNDEYDYDYSHKEIEEAREKLKYLIIKYLIEHYDGKYYIYELENITIMTVKEAKKTLRFFHDYNIISKENYLNYVENYYKQRR